MKTDNHFSESKQLIPETFEPSPLVNTLIYVICEIPEGF